MEQMNRLTEMVRIRKILAKKPENRTQIDLELLMSETQGVRLSLEILRTRAEVP